MSNKRYAETCAYCGQPFIAKSAKGKYCNANCRQKQFGKKKNNSSDNTIARLVLLRKEIDKPSLHIDCTECKRKEVPFHCYKCGRIVKRCYDAFNKEEEKICLWCWSGVKKKVPKGDILEQWKEARIKYKLQKLQEWQIARSSKRVPVWIRIEAWEESNAVLRERLRDWRKMNPNRTASLQRIFIEIAAIEKQKFLIRQKLRKEKVEKWDAEHPKPIDKEKLAIWEEERRIQGLDEGQGGIIQSRITKY